jgi:ribonuclease VapC
VLSKERVYVLDSFAVLAYLEGEYSADRVRRILSDAQVNQCTVFMSLINLGEVMYITERERGLARAQETLALIEQLPIKIIPVTQQSVFTAAHIKAQCPVSYADAFAIAVAREHGAVVVTGDPEFRRAQDFIKIEWLRRKQPLKQPR